MLAYNAGELLVALEHSYNLDDSYYAARMAMSESADSVTPTQVDNLPV